MPVGMYLGNPLSGLYGLPEAEGGWTSPPSRRDTVTALAGGGTAVSRALRMRRTYALSFGGLNQAEANLILSLYSGVLGGGPYALVDRSWPNLLALDASSFGVRRGSAAGWSVASGQTNALTSAVAPYAPGSGVVAWAGATTGSFMIEGTIGAGAGEANTSRACPLLPAESFTVSMWARTASGTAALSAAAAVRSAGLSVHSNTFGTSTAVTSTGWTKLTATLTTGSSVTAGQFVCAMVQCATASAPTVYLSNPMVTLDSAAAWSVGMGVPRVVFTAAPAWAVPVAGRFSVDLALAEV